jgi:hypothetical protein
LLHPLELCLQPLQLATHLLTLEQLHVVFDGLLRLCACLFAPPLRERLFDRPTLALARLFDARRHLMPLALEHLTNLGLVLGHAHLRGDRVLYVPRHVQDRTVVHLLLLPAHLNLLGLLEQLHLCILAAGLGFLVPLGHHFEREAVLDLLVGELLHLRHARKRVGVPRHALGRLPLLLRRVACGLQQQLILRLQRGELRFAPQRCVLERTELDAPLRRLLLRGKEVKLLVVLCHRCRVGLVAEQHSRVVHIDCRTDHRSFARWRTCLQTQYLHLS